jgi:hypothetical protein
MYKPDDFNNKIIDENKLISLIEPGNRIFLSSGSAMPVRVAKAIATSENLLGYDLEIIQITAARDYFTDESSSNRNYRYKTFHSGETAFEEGYSGKKDYYPANLLEIPYLFAIQAIEIDIAVVAASPPDKRGYMNLGIAIDVADEVIKNAAVVIAEVNPNIPITYGDTLIHVDQVDHIIFSDEPLIERKRTPYDSLQDRIGWHVSNLIPDGATVVMHVGRLFDAIAHHLKTKKDLGILTNAVSDWVIDLVEAGAISRDRKRELGGQINTSYCYGTQKLYDYVNNNPLIGFYPITKLATPLIIRRIPKLISIMNVEKIDVTASRVLVYAGDDLLSGEQDPMGEKEAQYKSKQGKIAVLAVRHKRPFSLLQHWCLRHALLRAARSCRIIGQNGFVSIQCLLIHLVNPSLFSLIRPVFQYVSGLAIQSFANCLQCRETNRFGLPGFENGKVRLGDAYLFSQLAGGHLSFGHHYIQIYYDGHNSVLLPLHDVICFVFEFDSLGDNISYHPDDQAHKCCRYCHENPRGIIKHGN